MNSSNVNSCFRALFSLLVRNVSVIFIYPGGELIEVWFVILSDTNHMIDDYNIWNVFENLRCSSWRSFIPEIVVRNFNNLFLVNVPILYSLKTPENRWFSGVFRWYKMAILVINGLNLPSDQVVLKIFENSKNGNLCEHSYSGLICFKCI